MSKHGICTAVLLGLIGAGATLAEPLQIAGAGATFPAPLYARWFSEYKKTHPSIEFVYQPIGSGAGSRKLAERVVFFSATDAPLSTEQLAVVKFPVFHLPTTMGAVVPVVNIPGFKGELRLSGAVLADIFQGRVASWDDPRIKASNPDTALPATRVTAVHRSDPSGTTFIFTEYLAKMSRTFASQSGSGLTVSWSGGVERSGSSALAHFVAEVPGAIGYVELTYALENKLSYASVQNAAGQYVKATFASIQEAGGESQENVPSDFRMSLTNAPGARSYPISSFTWLLVPEKPADKARGRALADFMRWALTSGQKYCSELGYAPLPEGLVALELAALKRLSP
ncbi:MAG: phosphate ABC transporter substrate-binding protein PstS [Thermoanaerobaculia bacterium]